MKIIRHGIEYKLTHEELFEAYCEWEHICDVEYVIDMLPEFDIDGRIPAKEIHNIAHNMRSYALSRNVSDYAALEKVLNDYLKENSNVH